MFASSTTAFVNKFDVYVMDEEGNFTKEEVLTDQKQIQKLICSKVPGIDDVIVEYVQGYLNDAATAIANSENNDESENPVEDLIRPMLEDAAGGAGDIDGLCDQLSKLLQEVEQKADPQKGSKLAKLAAPVNMVAQQAQINKVTRAQVAGTDLAHAKGRTVASQVDIKKLRKAEARIAAKMEKRGI
ncbi:ATP-binding cassette, regulator of translational elongation, partial [Coemansia sp. RSA 2703]